MTRRFALFGLLILGCSSPNEPLSAIALAAATPSPELCKELGYSSIIVGTEAGEEIVGTIGNDCILGLGGDDIIRAEHGDDLVFGGPGDDEIHGHFGHDLLYGNEGSDAIFGEQHDDQIFGGPGDDRQLSGYWGHDVIHGDEGHDYLEGGPDDDVLEGGAGNDLLEGGPGADLLDGGDCHDRTIQDAEDTAIGGNGWDGCIGAGCEAAPAACIDACAAGQHCQAENALCVPDDGPACDASGPPDAGVPPLPPEERVPPGCDAALRDDVATDFAAAARCIYTGANAAQKDLTATIDPLRIAVLRGRVLDVNGAPLAGVRVSVLNRAAYGYTVSRAGGWYDLAVDGGGPVTLRFAREGFLISQRTETPVWRQFAVFPDVVLLAPAPAAPPVQLSTLAAPTLVKGPTSDDDRGQRQHTVLLTPGTKAKMRFADGHEEPIDSVDVRITEYTVGARGPEAMPGSLPPTSGYTYAADLSVAAAEAAGAETVVFDPPLKTYVDNFLDFPVGIEVPTGYFDARADAWKPSANGLIVAIVGVTGGLADVDVTGDGLADTGAALTALAIDDAERAVLACEYGAGRQLWRVRIPHFTPWDCNWSLWPPIGALFADLDVGQSGPDGCGSSATGSIIGCTSQSLGEVLDVPGTPYTLHYQSERTSGRRDTRSLDIQVSGASVPEMLVRMDVRVEVLGNEYKQSFPPGPNRHVHFTWDGLDAFGRKAQGVQTATVHVDYVYQGEYRRTAGFALAGGSQGISGTDRNKSTEILYTSSWTGQLGYFDSQGLGLGGFTISSHHVYDAPGRTLLEGTGGFRSVLTVGDRIELMAGSGQRGFGGDNGPAIAASMDGPHSLVDAADGTVYFADENNRRVRAVGRDGVIRTVAGNGTSSNSGDGGPATAAGVNLPVALAIGTDGTLYIGQRDGRVRAVGTDGIIRSVAGDLANSDLPGDGGPARKARIRDAHALVVAPDGTMYIADGTDNRIRVVGPDGIIQTYAGGGTEVVEGGLARNAALAEPLGLALGADGSLYVTEYAGHRVRRIEPSGRITTVAGTGMPGNTGDGGPANAAALNAPHTVAIAADGALYIADEGNRRIRRVRTDGVIENAAGSGQTLNDGDFKGDARAAGFKRPRVVHVHRDGSIWIADHESQRLRRVTPAMPGFSYGESWLPSREGASIFHFDPQGHHVDSRDAMTGAFLQKFEYDAAGRLIALVDRSGLRTRIERDGDGRPLAIVGPYGHRSVLGLDANGRLDSFTRPAGDVTTMTYAAGGLLTSISRDGVTSRFDYDELGRLVTDTHASGFFQSLVREVIEGGFAVTHTLNGERPHRYEVTATGRREVDAAGLLTSRVTTPVETTVTAPTFTLRTRPGTDPRFGLLVPTFSETDVTPTSQQHREVKYTRTATLTDPRDPFSLQTYVKTAKVTNGGTTTERWDSPTRTLERVSPMGRKLRLTFDDAGRVSLLEAGTLTPIETHYDDHGRVAYTAQGERATVMTYGADGFPSVVTNALGEDTQLVHDANGRLVEATTPDGAVTRLAWDALDRLVSVTPAGRPAHHFDWENGLLTGYRPPAGEGFTRERDAFLDVASETGSAGAITITHDPATGRPTRLVHPAGQIDVRYLPTGMLGGLDADGGQLDFTYFGMLPFRQTWSGAISGQVERRYDSLHRMNSEAVNGSGATGSTSYVYDKDGLILTAGPVTMTWRPDVALPIDVKVGPVAETFQFDGYAELFSTEVKNGTTALYARTDGRDALARVITRQESVKGVAHAYGYAYDARGRLASVTRDGAEVEAYGYDNNGNRLNVRRDGIEVSASFGDNDQLLSQGGVSFTYDPSGQLDRRTDGNSVTDYDYDLLGNLRRVALPDGRTITYVVDGLNRRIGKRVNGALQRGFLYNVGGQVLAQVRDDGKTVNARFIYASRRHVPDVMHANSRYYRLVTDAVGSVRLVVDTLNGQIVQELDYDGFGRVVRDTNPGFQPFGFAGGLYDPDTGLVRFGARDYDASTGRFTAPDPSGFAGQDTNLYAYAGSDPVNFIDPSGHLAWSGPGALAGMATNVAGYLIANYGSGCITAGGLFAAAAAGALGGVLAVNGWNSAAVGAIVNVVQAGINDFLDGDGEVGSFEDYAASAAQGAIGGSLGAWKNPLGTSVRPPSSLPYGLHPSGNISRADIKGMAEPILHLGRGALDWVQAVVGTIITNLPSEDCCEP